VTTNGESIIPSNVTVDSIYQDLVNFINDYLLDTEELMPHKRRNVLVMYTQKDPTHILDLKFQTTNVAHILPIMIDANWLSTILNKSFKIFDDNMMHNEEEDHEPKNEILCCGSNYCCEECNSFLAIQGSTRRQEHHHYVLSLGASCREIFEWCLLLCPGQVRLTFTIQAPHLFPDRTGI
jgi:hypothetical protein